MGVEQGLGGDLERWLTPFLEVVGRKTRRTWTPLYVQGLLGPEGRRVCSRWRPGWGCRATTSRIIS
jgi:hypothetical protein